MTTTTDARIEEVAASIARECRRQLESAGEIVSESGVIPRSQEHIFVHTDFGPEKQDKDTNQDFVLGWCAPSPCGNDMQWAVAIADGVTSSWRSELAAQVACWTGLSGLVTSGEESASNRGWQGLNAACDGVDRLTEAFLPHSETLCPADEFPATWDYMVRSGLFFQTTLLLVWREGTRVILVSVGDGGAAIRESASATPEESDWSILTTDLSAEYVNVIGPSGHDVLKTDAVLSVDIDSFSILALYTDGIGRVAQPAPSRLMSVIARESADSDRRTNVAEETINLLMESSPDELQDNLTLVVITQDAGDQPCPPLRPASSRQSVCTTSGHSPAEDGR